MSHTLTPNCPLEVGVRTDLSIGQVAVARDTRRNLQFMVLKSIVPLVLS